LNKIGGGSEKIRRSCLKVVVDVASMPPPPPKVFCVATMEHRKLAKVDQCKDRPWRAGLPWIQAPDKILLMGVLGFDMAISMTMENRQR